MNQAANDPLCPLCHAGPPSMTLEWSLVAGEDSYGSTTQVRVPICAKCGHSELQRATKAAETFGAALHGK